MGKNGRVAVEAYHVNGFDWPSPARTSAGEEGTQWSSSAASGGACERGSGNFSSTTRGDENAT